MISSSIITISLSGLHAATNKLALSAQNVANQHSVSASDSTKPYTPWRDSQISLETGGVRTVSEEALLSPETMASLQEITEYYREQGLPPLTMVSPEAELVRQIEAQHLFMANLTTLRTANAMHGSLLDMAA